MAIDYTAEEGRREAAKIGSPADYYRFSPIVNSALKHYCNKLIATLNDTEIGAANEFIKKDLFESLRNVQNTLAALNPKDQEAMNNLPSKVYENQRMILDVLKTYEHDFKDS